MKFRTKALIALIIGVLALAGTYSADAQKLSESG